ncbi:hypothetical protein LIER_21001 [Lithospermum erythrorhizon]|uniref:Mitochondrial protein n=1 Tax=Lithospermum erythrorhizon TaxID=34254 RepID=A0AAV3QUA9_LITER
MISAKKLSKWINNSHNTSIGQLFSIQHSSSSNSLINSIPHCNPILTPVLENFEDIFAPPTKLPLHRNTDHTIALKPDAQARKFPPYQYSDKQKTEIETIVSELLSSGFIQPSNSAFASPVILVKKKDGTWRFCVDYSFLRKFVLVFFDDILIYSTHIEKHISHLQQVLLKLRENRLFAKPTKCAFGQPHIEYLGHIISASGIQADTSKIDAMLAWPRPNNLKSLRGFLGLTGYYRKFIKGYGILAKPLTNLLRKDAFQWTNEASLAFESLKSAMTNTPVLALPNYSLTFIVETDASSRGYGDVLMQEERPWLISARLGI